MQSPDPSNELLGVSWIPIWLHAHDHWGTLEIQADTTHLQGHQNDLDLAILFIANVSNNCLSLLGFNITMEFSDLVLREGKVLHQGSMENLDVLFVRSHYKRLGASMDSPSQDILQDFIFLSRVAKNEFLFR